MWPFRKRNRQAIVDSEQAVLDAHRAVRRVEARNGEVHKISGSLRSIRERNHFAENLRSIMERG